MSSPEHHPLIERLMAMPFLKATSIEIKQIRVATGTTLNQVRAVKFIPLVAYKIPIDQWWVIPPHDVVRLIAQKTRSGRGQHSENPFEDNTLTLSLVKPFAVPDPSQLREATLSAISDARSWDHLRAVMTDIRERSIALAQDSLRIVNEALSSGPAS